MKESLLRILDDLETKRGTYKVNKDIFEDCIRIGKIEAFDYAIQELKKVLEDNS